MRPLVIGIDPATNTGICEGRVGETPTLSAQRFRVSSKDEIEDVFGRATFFFADFLRTRTPDLVAIETPVWVSGGLTNADTVTLTRGLYGIISGIVKAKRLTIMRAPVPTWRKYFLGSGKLPGADAKRECQRVCGYLKWDAPTEDAAEAAGIWSWGCSQVDPKHAHRVEPLLARLSA